MVIGTLTCVALVTSRSTKLKGLVLVSYFLILGIISKLEAQCYLIFVGYYYFLLHSYVQDNVEDLVIVTSFE